jgi:hypothetical protein
MNKWTPGPWDASRNVTDQNNCPCVIDGNDLVVAVALDDGKELDECDANARLIAAAPEMAELLVECEEILARMDTLRHICPEFPALDKIRAILEMINK